MKFFLYLLFILFLFSCSDMKKKELKTMELSDSRLEVGCQLNTDSLSKILELRVKDELNCLKDWLTLFTNVVKSQRPGEMGIRELLEFLDGGLGDKIKVPKGMDKVIKALYELNYLIGSGNREYITKEQLHKLIDIAIVFNEEIIPIELDFSKSWPVTYQWHQKRRRENFNSISRIANSIAKHFRKDRRSLDQVHIESILDVFISSKSQKNLEMVKDFLTLKKMVLGGHSKILTYKELYKLVKKSPVVFSLVYDAVKFKDIQFKNALEGFSFFNKALGDFSRKLMVKGRRGDRKILSIKGVERLFRKLYKSYLPYDPFKDDGFILFIKEVFFGGGTYFTINQFREGFKFFLNISEKLQFFQRIYREHQALFDRRTALGELKVTHLKVRNKKEKEWLYELQDIFDHYLFYNKSWNKTPPVYAKKTQKHLYGVLEIIALENLAKKIMLHIEKTYPCDGGRFHKKNRCKKEDYGMSWTEGQFNLFFQKISPFLIKAGAIDPGREKSLADSLRLLSDIFLQNSNGNSRLDYREFTEQVVNLLGANIFTSAPYNRMRSSCSLDYKSRVEPDCFFENYFDEVFQRDAYSYFKLKLPNLYQYSQSVSPEKQKLFLKGVDGYTRVCQTYRNGDPIYMGRGDMYTTLVGVLNIESIMIRYDSNGNNQIDPNEFDQMYSVFRSTVNNEVRNMSGFLNGILGDKFKRKILKYIFVKRKIPGVEWDSLSLLKREKYFSRVVNREDFTNVLSVIGSRTGPDFDYCETLR